MDKDDIIVALKASQLDLYAINRKLLEALEGLMPLMDGECCYCSGGSPVEEDGHHFDADNIWHGDPVCLNDSYYDEAREAIAAIKEKPPVQARG